MGKYDLPIDAKYESRFVDPGLETFKAAALNYRDRFDKNSALANNLLASIANEEFMPGESDQTRQEMMDNINRELGSIMETGAYHTADMAINRAVQYYTADPKLARKRQNYKEWQKTEAKVQQYGMHNMYIPNLEEFQHGSSFIVDEEGNETPVSYRDRAQKVEDYNATIQALVGNVRQNKGFIDKYGLEGVMAMQGYLSTGGTAFVEGVTPERMNSMLSDLLSSYKMTPAGAQHVDRLVNSNQNEHGAPVSPGEADKSILEYMKAVTKNQVGLDLINTPEGMQPSSSPDDQTDALDFTAQVYLRGSKNAVINAETQKSVLGLVESDKFQNSYEMDVDRIVIDFANQGISDGHLNAIFENTPFEGYEDKLSLLQTLDSFGYTADEASMSYVLSHLGIQDTEANRKSIQAISNQLTSRMAAVGLDNMGGVLNQKYTGVIFRPDGNSKIVGNVAYPTGKMYIPKDQADNYFDLGWGDWGIVSGQPDYDEVKVGNNPIFMPAFETGADGNEYLVIDQALGRPIDLSIPANQEKLTQASYNLTESDLRKSRAARENAITAAVGGTINAPNILNPMTDVLSALNISTPTINGLSNIVERAMKEGNRELVMLGGNEIARQFNKIVKELARDKGKYPTQADAERAALILFESSF